MAKSYSEKLTLIRTEDLAYVVLISVWVLKLNFISEIQLKHHYQLM